MRLLMTFQPNWGCLAVQRPFGIFQKHPGRKKTKGQLQLWLYTCDFNAWYQVEANASWDSVNISIMHKCATLPCAHTRTLAHTRTYISTHNNTYSNITIMIALWSVFIYIVIFTSLPTYPQFHSYQDYYHQMCAKYTSVVVRSRWTVRWWTSMKCLGNVETYHLFLMEKTNIVVICLINHK